MLIFLLSGDKSEVFLLHTYVHIYNFGNPEKYEEENKNEQ